MSGIINSAGSKSGVIGTTSIDYEEGEFTFAVTASGCTFNINGSYTTGKYCKIGNLVHIQGLLGTTTGTTGSGTAHLTLPFANGDFVQEGEACGGGMAGYGVDVGGTNSVLTWEMPAGPSTYVKFAATVDGGAWGTIAFSTPTYYMFSIHYMTG